VSTFLSISLYATLVLVGLTVFSAAMIGLGGWLVANTDDADADH
jgi:biotin transporter BioY